MDIFDSMKDKFSETSQSIIKKTKDSTETMRVNSQIKEMEKELRNELYHLGIQFYDREHELHAPEYDESFQRITDIQKRISDAHTYLENLNRQTLCPSCGRPVEEGSVFCIYCGSRIVPEEPVTEPEPAEDVIICANCGKEIPADSAFCVYCGSPVSKS